MKPSTLHAAVVGLLIARWLTELFLSLLNRRHVRRHAGEVPEAFRDFIDCRTYDRSIEYTLARNRLGMIEDTWSLVVLLVVLLSGVLPKAFNAFIVWRGDSAWWTALFLLAVGFGLWLTSLPLAWHEQFQLEERFGFNTTSPALWVVDRLKALGLTFALGYPLLVLILRIVEWSGDAWWLWASLALIGFQLLMLVLAPVIILPLFNKFTPLPEGSLRERLMNLARRTRFHARSIQVMDGSKRSRHSNAFFTGFGRLRKIVLFDTLVQQLTEPELEAVLAHEIGHARLWHIPKLMLWSVASTVAGFYALAWLAQQGWFYKAFGFLPGNIVPALLLFSLLSGAVTFWLSPVLHFWSRRFEYQADAFAAATLGQPEPLIHALRKLHEKNLSNLTPHPVYSAFHYSHPTQLEREQALRGKPSPTAGTPAPN